MVLIFRGTHLIDGLDAVPLLRLRAERVGQQAGARHGRRRARRGHELVSRSGDGLSRQRRVGGRLELLARLLRPELAGLCRLLELLDARVCRRVLAASDLHLSEWVETFRIASIGEFLFPSRALDLRRAAVDA